MAFEVVLPKWSFIRFGSPEKGQETEWHSDVIGIFPREGNERLEAILPPNSIGERELYMTFDLRSISVFYKKLEDGQYQWQFKYGDNMTVIFRDKDFIGYTGLPTEEQFKLYNAEWNATPLNT